MIDSKFENNTLQCFNNISPGSFDVTGNYYIADLDTNLPLCRGWVSMLKGQHISIELPNTFLDTNPLGINIKFVNDQELLTYNENMYFREGEPDYHFFAPYKEMAWGSFYSLFIENEYSGMFEIKPEDVIYDLGANVGVFTKWVERNYKYKEIHAFEPTPKFLNYLNSSFNSDNIMFYDKAISGKKETAFFNLHKDAVANSLKIANENKIGTVEVQCVNLEEFINEEGLQPPTFIKMDIEGSEYDAIEGLSDNFISNIRVLILEYHNDHWEEKNSEEFKRLFGIIKRMLNLGFVFDIKKGDVLNYMAGTIIFKK